MELYRTPIGTIYSIKIGLHPKDGMNFNLGQKIYISNDECEISEIVRDENNFFLFGIVRYIIYAKDIKNGNHFVWKTYENVPISVTCKKEV
jgi:hypothetical protein